MSIRLICAADIHFGRIASVAEAWERLVDHCLYSSADALLLAGDIADDESLFFEIYPLFRKGMARLRAAKIPVIVIAGNHDGNLLTQMQRSLGFHLLGRDGKWERITLSCRGRAVHIDGLSFVERNPLQRYDLPPVPAGEPLIGMLHCDLDGPPESPYSPVSQRELSNLPHTAWVLGHIHVPRIVQEQPMILSCGSLQGLDITETGIHGAWSMEIDSKLTAQLVPLAPLRWEIVELDVTDEEELELRLQMEMDKALGGMAGKVRFILRGRTTLTRPLVCPEGVESIQNRIQPPIDLKKIAEGSDLPALLARELLDLREADTFEQLQRSLQAHPYLKQMPESWPKAEEMRELLREQGMALLSELMEQKRAP
jgi:DNA repair exonuclease SbcCD nuclease subunit